MKQDRNKRIPVYLSEDELLILFGAIRGLPIKKQYSAQKNRLTSLLEEKIDSFNEEKSDEELEFLNKQYLVNYAIEDRIESLDNGTMPHEENEKEVLKGYYNSIKGGKL